MINVFANQRCYFHTVLCNYVELADPAVKYLPDGIITVNNYHFVIEPSKTTIK